MYVIKAKLNPLVKIRYAEGLTTYQLAEMAGMTRGRISQVENGITTKKIPKKILRAVEQLGYDPEKVQAEYLEWMRENAREEKVAKSCLPKPRQKKLTASPESGLNPHKTIESDPLIKNLSQQKAQTTPTR